jgi:hypothetical protein
MHQMKILQLCQAMEKVHIEKRCWKYGEKYQSMTGGEHHQNFQNQEKLGNFRELIKKRKGGKLESVHIKVIYGDLEEVKAKLGCHTAYVERTNLTSRTMNGRLVRKTLSFSKELRFLEASSALEDALCAPRCAITTKTGNVPLTTESEEKD